MLSRIARETKNVGEMYRVLVSSGGAAETPPGTSYYVVAAVLAAAFFDAQRAFAASDIFFRPAAVMPPLALLGAAFFVADPGLDSLPLEPQPPLSSLQPSQPVSFSPNASAGLPPCAGGLPG